jgi:hypothetical protein
MAAWLLVALFTSTTPWAALSWRVARSHVTAAGRGAVTVRNASPACPPGEELPAIEEFANSDTTVTSSLIMASHGRPAGVCSGDG